MKIACIGEAMVELALQPGGSTARVGFAGDTLNTAIYLKRAAPALDVSYVTRLGRDDFSSRLSDFIAAESISVADIEISKSKRVGLYAIITDERGERSFSYWRENSAAREMFQTGDQVSFAALESYDLVYLSAITLAIWPDWVRVAFFDWAARFRASNGLISFDSNYRSALWNDPELAKKRIAQMWALVDIALPSVDDEMDVFGDTDAVAVAARLAKSGITNGALKCGESGPVSLAENVMAEYPPASNVVDTTAAGDSFNGGYLASLLSGGGQAEALMAGHQLASRVVGAPGAIIDDMS